MTTRARRTSGKAGRGVGTSEGAFATLRRGVAASPELKVGFKVTVFMALLSAAGRLAIPILIQQILDRGTAPAGGYRAGFVYTACAIALVVIIVVYEVSRRTYNRLVTMAESMLKELRVRAFAHIHKLSMAEHTSRHRGELTARVTSDIEQLARFAQWGAIAWVVSGAALLGTLGVMAFYSWQLTALVALVYAPLVPYLRWVQRRQLVAYDKVRVRVGETMTHTSEAVMGAAVIRAYGYREPVRRRLHDAIGHQYQAQLGAVRYFAVNIPVVDVFGAVALGSVVGAGVWWGPQWGLTSGSLVAFLFLVTLLLSPIAELGEVLDQTQTAIAGWRRVLAVLDIEPDVVDPEAGRELPSGALAVSLAGVDFAYRGHDPVLHGVTIDIEPGQSVAVVGETGSGKTTFSRLLCRLADPTEGIITVGGVDLREVSADARHMSIRMVPQDGFLFNTTISENVRFGRPGRDPAHPPPTDDEVGVAFEKLGLADWLAGLPQGLETVVGGRGENLSVGERQLVALARAELADPGLLILDEATSAVDPKTERALSRALDTLSQGRTVVSVAHRLATAEAADLVLVFDAGVLIERGTHADLVAGGGSYARLHQSWVGVAQAAR